VGRLDLLGVRRDNLLSFGAKAQDGWAKASFLPFFLPSPRSVAPHGPPRGFWLQELGLKTTAAKASLIPSLLPFPCPMGTYGPPRGFWLQTMYTIASQQDVFSCLNKTLWLLLTVCTSSTPSNVPPARRAFRLTSPTDGVYFIDSQQRATSKVGFSSYVSY
jgi:hypothetical protein